jgi:hypothetical protein
MHANDTQHEINLQKKSLTPSCDDIVEYGWDNNFYKLIDVTELLTNFTLSERSCVRTFLLSLWNLLNYLPLVCFSFGEMVMEMCHGYILQHILI